MQTEKPNFQALLSAAVSEPGKIMEAYHAFYGYSFGNQLLAYAQCIGRGIPVGPIATYKAWQQRGRNVKAGEKAIALCMPVGCKKTSKDKDGNEKESFFTRFTFRNLWFVLSQTDGEELEIPAVPEWNQERALSTLGISLVAFDHPDGNVQGFAREKSVAINPMAQLPLKTLFHEIAHIVLGHTGTQEHAATLPRDIKEVEAESVAMLCLAALNLPGVEFCRGYIQAWLSSKEIPEKSAQKIMHAADQILKAGRVEELDAT